MVALSTSFFPLDTASPETLCDFLRQIGVNRVELEYRIPSTVLPGLIAALKTAGITAGSVHNICPRNDDAPPGISANTFFHLAELDGEIRRRALDLTCRTLELAHEVEARVVVLHCGRVAMDTQFDGLVRLYRDGRIDTPEADKLRQTQLELLQHKKPRHRDALFFSLEQLAETADKYDLVLGLENRHHYFDLPGPEEFDEIFREFEGAPFGYWHDAGHAWVNEQLGFQTSGQLIEAQKSRLVGMHLHDAQGLKDHRPPGGGDMDLGALAKYLSPDVPLVIELAPGTPMDQAAEGVTWVRSHLLVNGVSPDPKDSESADQNR